MKHYALALALFSTATLAQVADGPVAYSGVSFEGDPNGAYDLSGVDLPSFEPVEELERIQLRPRRDGETEAQYMDYLYFTAGMDILLLPSEFFAGAGIQDPRGIVGADVTARLGVLGMYGGTRDSTVGVGVRGWVRPLRLVNDGFLGNLYYAHGRAWNSPLGSGTAGDDYFRNSSEHEIGYDNDLLRVALVRQETESVEPTGPQRDTWYLLRVGLRLSRLPPRM